MKQNILFKHGITQEVGVKVQYCRTFKIHPIRRFKTEYSEIRFGFGSILRTIRQWLQTTNYNARRKKEEGKKIKTFKKCEID